MERRTLKREGDFFEEDEDIEDIRRAWEEGTKGVTTAPPSHASPHNKDTPKGIHESIITDK